MGYTPERGFTGWWDFYAEQLMLYILGAGSPTHPIRSDMMYCFQRHSEKPFHEGGFIHSWFGSLFTHQFTHAWMDFRNTRDTLGIDWWENSVRAVEANRLFCREMGKHYKTLKGSAWGLTPCDGPWGYNGRYGAAPSALKNDEHIVDGTVSVAGAAGSVALAPQSAMEVLNDYYALYPELWGKYGFKDSFNLDVSPEWYASGFIGIDKGITLLMIENYFTGMVWELYMKNACVQEGLERIGIVNTGENTKIA